MEVVEVVEVVVVEVVVVVTRINIIMTTTAAVVTFLDRGGPGWSF